LLSSSLFLFALKVQRYCNSSETQNKLGFIFIFTAPRTVILFILIAAPLTLCRVVLVEPEDGTCQKKGLGHECTAVHSGTDPIVHSKAL